MSRAPWTYRGTRGFTLVELVVVIVIVGILAVVVGNLVGNFVGGYTQAGERARLAGVGRAAIERMAREIRQAVPNSIRIGGGGRRIAFLRAPMGGRYLAVGTSASRLQVGASVDQESFVAYGMSGLDANRHQLVVYPLIADTLYSDLDLAANASGPRARVADAGGAAGFGGRTVRLRAGDDFYAHSPRRRILATDGVVALCYLAGDQDLRMAVNTPIGAVPDTSCSSGDSLLAAPVTSASFGYAEGTLTRAGLVRVFLRLTSPQTGESVDFQREVHIRNVP